MHILVGEAPGAKNLRQSCDPSDETGPGGPDTLSHKENFPRPVFRFCDMSMDLLRPFKSTRARIPCRNQQVAEQVEKRTGQLKHDTTSPRDLWTGQSFLPPLPTRAFDRPFPEHYLGQHSHRPLGRERVTGPGVHICPEATDQACCLRREWPATQSCGEGRTDPSRPRQGPAVRGASARPFVPFVYYPGSHLP